MQKIPLLKDNHNHFFIYSMLAEAISLKPFTSKDQVTELLKKSPGDRVGVALGWDDSRYTFSPNELDRLPPLVICNLSLHGFLINARAREMLRDRDEELIGRIDDAGWCEKNLTRILGFLAALNPLDKDRTFRFLTFMEQQGIWISEDMFVPDNGFVRLLSDSGLTDRILPWTDLEAFVGLTDDSRSRIRGIKIFTDGTLGQRTAALKVPYRNGVNGLLNHTPAELDELVSNALRVCGSVSIHAIGDRAIEQVLDVLPAHRRKNRDACIRIEHCQFISLENACRARELGVVLCMQPNFSSDSVVYLDRLPRGYAEKNNPFRMLIDEAGYVPGVDLIFGSDGMPHGVQPALEQSLFPRHDSQKLSLDEFQAGYCLADFDPGQVEIIIDQKERRVQTRILING